MVYKLRTANYGGIMRKAIRRWYLGLVPLSGLLIWMTSPVSGQSGAKNGEWPTYGGDLANTRYAPLDQINARNFNKLEMAWRFKTENLGPRPEYQFEVDAADGRTASSTRRPERAAPSSRSTPQPANCCGCTASTKARAAQRRRASSPDAACRTGPTAARNASSTSRPAIG